MRRRRLLALGAAAVGLAGCAGNASEGWVSRPTRTSREPSDASSTETDRGERDTTQTRIGGSLNGRPYRIGDDLDLIEKSGATWIHAFLDVRKKYDADVDPREDPDVVALRRASREVGAKLFVSLQWNFIGIFGEQEREHVPPAGSARERGLIEYATELLSAIEEPVDVVGLGNEPVWETLDADFVGRDAPLVPFTRKLKDHLVEHYAVGEPRFLLGAFNRLFSQRIRIEYQEFYRQLLEMARTDEDVDGIDLHVHYRSLREAEGMLDVARQSFPDGTITATEFSPMWRYENNVDTPIADFEGGDVFADTYGIPNDVTVTEYLEAAKDDQLSPVEMADFMEAMPWYNVDFVEDMYDLLAGYDVEVGTFGFLVEDDVDNIDWTEGWAPFPINCLFQPALIDSVDGAHPHYLDDFRRRT